MTRDARQRSVSLEPPGQRPRDDTAATTSRAYRDVRTRASLTYQETLMAQGTSTICDIIMDELFGG